MKTVYGIFIGIIKIIPGIVLGIVLLVIASGVGMVTYFGFIEDNDIDVFIIWDWYKALGKL